MAIRKSSISGTPSGNTANRPTSPQVGQAYFNGELGVLEIYTSYGWFPISAPPQTPTAVVATDSPSGRAFNNGRASIAFTSATEGGLPTSYTVVSSPGSYTTTGSSSPLIVTGLQSSTQYTYTVTAANSFGTSSSSSASSAVTATTVPQAPTINSISAGNAQASISFTAGATGGSAITGYSITSSPASTTTTQSASSSPYTFTGLTNGTAYTFTVTATNANGTSAASSASSSATPFDGQPDRAVFMGGVSSTYFPSNAISNIDYLSISTTGNATSFGNLITARLGFGGFSSSTRSIIGGGADTSSTAVSSIEYVTIASPSNGTSFGNLTNRKSYLTGALSNNTYGMWYGGAINGILPETAQMEYVTIASTGNGTLFGNLDTTVFGGAVGAGNTTRGIIATGPRNGGNNYTEVIQYFTWGTSGNTTTFGNASLQLAGASGTSSSTRMLFGGGYGVNGVQRSQIEYVTIATTGNSTSFGNLTVGRSYSGSTSNKTRGIFAGGADSGDWSTKTSIDYVTIDTTGNATNFGNLTVARSYIEGTSGSHGGLS